jgi:hypothetical protein
MMSRATWTNFWLKLEDWRLRQHFKRVEAILSRRDVSHLPDTLQKAREKQLEQLRQYAEQAVFPRNDGRFIYSPCFIDHAGRECAVAHLLMQSEQEALAQTIALNANYAYVPQMRFPELDDWAAQSGLTQDELALIQPGYWSNLWSLMPMALPIWILGFISLWFHFVQISLKKKPSWGSWIALSPTLPLFLLTLLLLWEARGADYLSTAYDVPEYIHKAAGADVMPLMFGVVLSLILLVAIVGVYRYRQGLFAKVEV